MPPFRKTATKKHSVVQAKTVRPARSVLTVALPLGFIYIGRHAEMVGHLQCGVMLNECHLKSYENFIHFKTKIVLLLHFWGDMSVFGGVLWCMILPMKHLLRKTLVPEKVHPGSCCWRFAKLNSDSWVNAAILENHAPTTRRILVLNKWILLNLIDFLVVLYHLHLSGS